jgi:hypothetical protein
MRSKQDLGHKLDILLYNTGYPVFPHKTKGGDLEQI